MSKIGRNDPCPCGSGKKYKHCCLRRDEETSRTATRPPARRKRPVAEDRPPRLLRLRVALDSMRGEEPSEPVTRTVEIMDDDTLFGLHLAIQQAFDWDNDHLFAFYMNNRLFNRTQEYSGDPTGESDLEDRGSDYGSISDTELRHFGLRRGKHFKYRFDFGDELIHTVEVLDSNAPRVESAEYPRVVDSVGQPPPQYPRYE